MFLPPSRIDPYPGAGLHMLDEVDTLNCRGMTAILPRPAPTSPCTFRENCFGEIEFSDWFAKYIAREIWALYALMTTLWKQKCDISGEVVKVTTKTVWSPQGVERGVMFTYIWSDLHAFATDITPSLLQWSVYMYVKFGVCIRLTVQGYWTVPN